MAKKHTKIVSLAYSDSENEDESAGEEAIKDEYADSHEDNESPNQDGKGAEENAVEVEPYFEDVLGDNDISIVDFHQSLFGKPNGEIQIPFPTKRKCPEDLQRRIEAYYEKVKMGSDLNKSIQKRKDLRNPSIYEKMISYCQINEMATNYPKQIYDPEPFLGSVSFYEELSRIQKEEMEKYQRERVKDGPKSSETASKRLAVPSIGGTEKKSKWDSAPATNSTSAVIAAALSKAQNLAQGKKPTVISAFGTINKRKWPFYLEYYHQIRNFYKYFMRYNYSS